MPRSTVVCLEMARSALDHTWLIWTIIIFCNLRRIDLIFGVLCVWIDQIYIIKRKYLHGIFPIVIPNLHLKSVKVVERIITSVKNSSMIIFHTVYRWLILYSSFSMVVHYFHLKRYVKYSPAHRFLKTLFLPPMQYVYTQVFYYAFIKRISKCTAWIEKGIDMTKSHDNTHENDQQCKKRQKDTTKTFDSTIILDQINAVKWSDVC